MTESDGKKVAVDEKNGVFGKLYAIDVADRVETKESKSGDLSYLSWAHAWAEAKKNFDVDYKVKEWDGKPYLFDENLGYLVMTSVTIEGQTYEMWLPVMDYNNQAMKHEPYEIHFKSGSITVNPASMMDINKTIMRCLVKNLAMFGLGLYIYAGEDVPENEEGKFVSPPMDLEKAKEVKITFGKFNGKTIQEIADEDVGYLVWLSESANSEKVKEASALMVESLQGDSSGEQVPKLSEDELNEFDQRVNEVAKLLKRDVQVLNRFIFQEVSKELDEEVNELNQKTASVYNKYLRVLESKVNLKKTESEKNEVKQEGLFEGNTTNPVSWGE